MSAEEPSSSRTARVSPSHQRNGHDDRTGSVSRIEETRGSMRHNHPEHLNTGPASLAAKGSISYIPHIDCSDAESEYSMNREQAGLNSSYWEQVVLHQGLGSGSVNGALQAQQEHFFGWKQSSSKHSLNMSHVLDESPKKSCQKFSQSPVHSTMGDLCTHNREKYSSSPLKVPQMGSRTASPTMECFHQSSFLGYAEQNGCSSTPLHFDEGRSVSIPNRSPRFQKPPRVHHYSNIDTNQGTSSVGQESCPVLSRAERMAALERRMVANGLSAPGRPRASPGHKRKRQAGVTHVGAVQMSDYCTTSGSESSESEVESNRDNCSSPVETTPASSIPRNKFSFGSLQLDEEPDEEGCHAFSDEDGGQIFSC